jgi:glycosyltransferase involved in cell wall biosynthesis
MKIGIVVPGRFHAFDLAKALTARGHDVTVFTNYPKWAVKRFGLSGEKTRSVWPHGIATRICHRLQHLGAGSYPEEGFSRWFGRWACDQLSRESWDVVHCFSGVSEELLRAGKNAPAQRQLVRASAHIRTQRRILDIEEQRVGVRLDRPSDWMIEREEREYDLAERIVVLSKFAYTSFVDEGVNPSKLLLLHLGASTDAFRPTPEVIEVRCQRILSGEPLNVLYVGALSFRKGIWDFAAIVRRLSNGNFRFRFVGPVTPEAQDLVAAARGLAEFIPKQPQRELKPWYSRGDVFVFPTVEDGFPTVLAQAQTSALPILSTPNCCAPDILDEGRTGWTLPIRDPEAFVRQLFWCDANRTTFAGMVRRLYMSHHVRTWDNVAADFETMSAGEVESSRIERAIANG